ncbi:SIMPL domain-containing protein [Methylocystis sp. 9N]|uniref:SIMPL domain-containing protein n=1 Tax=Methylocystis borbori TaxID=3118750 RepID=A0ABU7XHE4_9HYPH
MIRSVVSFSLGLIAIAAPAQADPLKDSVPNVMVTGEAYEDVAPDRASLRFGVVTERPAAAEAAAENNRAAQAILAELKELGVADADVETQGVTLAPFTVEERDAKGKPKAPQTFYRARNDLLARIRPVEKAGEIAGRLIDKGVNSFEGIEFDFAEPKEKLDALRAEAVKDAERRAKIYVEAAGVRLGRVLEIRPLDEMERSPRPYAAKMATTLEAAPATPLRPGLQRLSARVSIIWALSR